MDILKLDPNEDDEYAEDAEIEAEIAALASVTVDDDVITGVPVALDVASALNAPATVGANTPEVAEEVADADTPFL